MSHPIHPKRNSARVLLTSVFGPYACDDCYGSRAINPMELYQNQVTRVQGPFSLRMFHRSWGLMMIQANIEAPSTLLDFPTLDHFTAELREHDYDIIGISAIVPNLRKVQKMCALARALRPGATIVVGGHVANIQDLETRIDADHVVRGEGIAWFRGFLGEETERPINHPEIVSGFGGRTLGIRLRERPGDVAAVVVPSVGCPMGCNFCSTSAMFGGKGKFVNFYHTGQGYRSTALVHAQLPLIGLPSHDVFRGRVRRITDSSRGGRGTKEERSQGPSRSSLVARQQCGDLHRPCHRRSQRRRRSASRSLRAGVVRSARIQMRSIDTL